MSSERDANRSAEESGENGEPVVIRDKRRINPAGTASAAPAGSPVVDAAAGRSGDAAAFAEDGDGAAQGGAAQGGAADTGGTHPLGAELEVVRKALDERTADLQRVTAEYANYRRRVERDRLVAGEQATGQVLTALLPVLDDIDRARSHGDVTGPFATMADQLAQALGKFGLVPFGERGDAFDPTRHEAVAHLVSADVTESTCIDVMRRGYLVGDRLLRPAMVAVAEPGHASAPADPPAGEAAADTDGTES